MNQQHKSQLAYLVLVVYGAAQTFGLVVASAFVLHVAVWCKERHSWGRFFALGYDATADAVEIAQPLYVAPHNFVQRQASPPEVSVVPHRQAITWRSIMQYAVCWLHCVCRWIKTTLDDSVSNWLDKTWWELLLLLLLHLLTKLHAPRSVLHVARVAANCDDPVMALLTDAATALYFRIQPNNALLA